MSEKGQVVIPKDVRTRLRLGPGDQLEVIERPDGVLLRRPSRKSAESFEAITARIRLRVGQVGRPVSLEEMNASIAQASAAGGPRWDK